MMEAVFSVLLNLNAFHTNKNGLDKTFFSKYFEFGLKL